MELSTGLTVEMENTTFVSGKGMTVVTCEGILVLKYDKYCDYIHKIQGYNIPLHEYNDGRWALMFLESNTKECHIGYWYSPNTMKIICKNRERGWKILRQHNSYIKKMFGLNDEIMSEITNTQHIQLSLKV
jgi:hypothetical protein